MPCYLKPENGSLWRLEKALPGWGPSKRKGLWVRSALVRPEAARGQVGRERGQSCEMRLESCVPGWGVWILFQAQCEAIEGLCYSQ